MSSTETSTIETSAIHDAAQRRQLLQTAASAIAAGLAGQPAWRPAATGLDPALRAPRASFVTLEHHQQLRGCIGTLEARRPLIQDVAHNAHAAAFADPRFPPLQAAELDALHLQISILTPPVPLHFDSEEALLAQLNPGQDGLILSDGSHRGTFLPSVWEQLPRPRDFLAHLKRKAGLPANHWSRELQIARYGSESFGSDAAALDWTPPAADRA